MLMLFHINFEGVVIKVLFILCSTCCTHIYKYERSLPLNTKANGKIHMSYNEAIETQNSFYFGNTFKNKNQLDSCVVDI